MLADIALWNWPRILAIGFIISIFIVSCLLPKPLGYADSLKGWKDLRIWAAVLIAFQIFLYWIF
ncbi:MAG: hypothetical protein KDK37_13010 [Leptospiraceae bacterium]|nr:hypothetical protein [Leptospiraceae bacterium]MCB1305199.1 hypothetical protein [Leptospiraceae bacterium]